MPTDSSQHRASQWKVMPAEISVDIPDCFKCRECLYWISEATVLVCGHTFCWQCVRELEDCPECSFDAKPRRNEEKECGGGGGGGGGGRRSIVRGSKATTTRVTSNVAVNEFMRQVVRMRCECGEWTSGTEMPGHANTCGKAVFVCNLGNSAKKTDRCEYSCRDQEHRQNHRSVCGYRTCQCRYCGKTVSMKEFSTHLQTDCQEWMVECESCKEQVLRGKMENHRMHLCAYTMMGCQLCGKELERGLWEEHMAEYNLVHFQWSLRKILELEGKVGEVMANVDQHQTQYSSATSLPYSNSTSSSDSSIPTPTSTTPTSTEEEGEGEEVQGGGIAPDSGSSLLHLNSEEFLDQVNERGASIQFDIPDTVVQMISGLANGVDNHYASRSWIHEMIQTLISQS